jgi:mannose-6-phosphate isomerase
MSAWEQNLGFLTKLLDSGMRLQTQVHPTAAFAKESTGSPWGKLECHTNIRSLLDF